jgi:hypothetical protein
MHNAGDTRFERRHAVAQREALGDPSDAEGMPKAVFISARSDSGA